MEPTLYASKVNSFTNNFSNMKLICTVNTRELLQVFSCTHMSKTMGSLILRKTNSPYQFPLVVAVPELLLTLLITSSSTIETVECPLKFKNGPDTSWVGLAKFKFKLQSWVFSQTWSAILPLLSWVPRYVFRQARSSLTLFDTCKKHIQIACNENNYTKKSFGNIKINLGSRVTTCE